VLPSGARSAAWADCAHRVRDLFAAHVGEAAVAERFHIPDDYAAFMGRVSGGWQWQAGMQQSLFTAPEVAEATAQEFSLWVTERNDEDGPQNDGFWLSIGWYSDKHATLLCCDRAHRRYGSVLDAHDDHPWLNGAESVTCSVLARSFLGFLWREGRRRTSRCT
jgi:hypothetical protein